MIVFTLNNAISIEAVALEKLTLNEARNLARNNIKTEEQYTKILDVLNKLNERQTKDLKNKVYRYDEYGNESLVFLGDIMTKDYQAEYDRYSDKLDALRLENEKKAILQYTDMLRMQLDINLLDFKNNLLENEAKLQEKRLEVGIIYKNQLESSRVNKELSIMEKESILKSMEQEYNKMNIILGFEEDKRYALDIESLFDKKDDLSSLGIPQDIENLAFDRSNQIERFREDIERMEREFKEVRKIDWNLEEKRREYNMKKQELEKNKQNLSYELENKYLDLLFSIEEINIIKSDLEFEQKQLKIQELYYDLGMITKQDYITKTEIIHTKSNELISAILRSYNSAIEYKRVYQDNPFL